MNTKNIQNENNNTRAAGLLESYALQGQLVRETAKTVKLAFLGGLAIGASIAVTLMVVLK